MAISVLKLWEYLYELQDTAHCWWMLAVGMDSNLARLVERKAIPLHLSAQLVLGWTSMLVNSTCSPAAQEREDIFSRQAWKLNTPAHL